ncbi:MAG: ABC transporter ATP-binding protein [Oligoflexia bacterium]|nr:ABC transporter ATP-binding protein [Oligoflexia bacterium]
MKPSHSNGGTDPKNVVEIRDLVFRYGQDIPVLDIQSLDIKKGEKVFIYGPSGSGKTTLLGLLAGVLAAKEGSIRLLGKDLVKMTAHERDEFRGNHMGYIFQMFNLIPYLSVLDNITLSCELNRTRKGRIPNGELKKSATSIAQELGIAEYLDKTITQLSVGQQQRVAVARAILGSPEIIIADEPTSALDYDHREKFLKLLFLECRKTQATVLFVSHDRQLEPLFDRCISLKEINRA